MAARPPSASGSPDRAPSAAPAGWFDRLDWLVLAGLLGIVAFGWCLANGKWTPAQWALPSAYLDPEKCDVIHALAMMKAAGEGEFVPLRWKQVSRLGAPEAANWNDWPLIEEMQVVVFGLLGRAFGLFGALNLGMLIGHWAAAATFYAVARALGCLRPWAFVGGLAYGLAPFLFAQSPHHITTEYVWHVPLFILVWKWVSTDGELAWGSRRFWAAVAIAAITGLQSPYFTNVFCQLTLLGGATLAWRKRSFAALKPALAVIAAAAIPFVLMNLDTWTYRMANGPNQGALSREYKWMEIYGLKLVDLVIPPVTHHAAGFAAFATAHRSGAPLLDEGSYLGLVGIAALALLVVVAARGMVDRGSMPAAAWQVLWIVLTFTTGGLNAILGAFGFTLFRTGCRYSVVILAIALVHAAGWLSRRQRHAEAGAASDTLRVGVITAVIGLTFLILWDQVPRGPTAEQQALIARQVEADRAFVADLETMLPADAMVFQVPVMDFPESPAPGIPSYDHFRPYLHGSRLRYSFGSMKGRPRDEWQKAVQAKLIEGAVPDQQAQKIRFNIANVNRAVDELQKRGFGAIYVNRNGFPDRGRGLVEALAELGFDAPPIESPLGDLACIPIGTPAAAGK
jgi:phosphoglycerol transferase